MVEAAEAAYRRTYLASDRRLERHVRAAPGTTSVTGALPAVGATLDGRSPFWARVRGMHVPAGSTASLTKAQLEVLIGIVIVELP